MVTRRAVSAHARIGYRPAGGEGGKIFVKNRLTGGTGCALLFSRGHTLSRGADMDLITTYHGSMVEGFLPAGWDLKRVDQLAAAPPQALAGRQRWWHPQCEPVPCGSVEDFDTFMGHEIAREVQLSRQAGRP